VTLLRENLEWQAKVSYSESATVRICSFIATVWQEIIGPLQEIASHLR
jgi:hypothetical protein